MIGWMNGAWAAPEVAVGAIAAVADGTEQVPGWAGAHAGIEFPWRRVAGGARVRAGLTAAGEPLVSVEPTARLWLSDPERPALSAVVGAGVQLEGGTVGPVVAGGLGVDLGPRPTRPRLEGTYHWAPTTEIWRLSLAAEVVFGRRPPAPEPAPAPVVAVPPPVVPTEGMVWYPAPVCAWLEGDAALRAAIAGQPEAWLDPNGLRTQPEGAPPEDPDRANFVIAGWPGDRIAVDDELVPTDETGLAVVVRPPGPGTLRVVGGGRTEVREVAVGNHQGLWIAVPPPPEIQVRFAVASSALDGPAREQLAALAEQAGGWGYEVRGGHSPEGRTAYNRELALARAEAVAAELRRLGVPSVRVAERIEVFAADAPPETLRIAIVSPTAPDGGGR